MASPSVAFLLALPWAPQLVVQAHEDAVGVGRIGVGRLREVEPEVPGGGELFVVLVNKSTVDEAITVDVASGLAGTVALFGFEPAGMLGPRGSLVPSATGFDVTLPARSARLAVAQMDCALPAAVAGLRVRRSGSSLVVTWTDVPGALDYTVSEDGSPSGAFTIVTGTAPSGDPGLSVPIPAGNRFYRVAARNTCGYGPAS